MARIAAGVSCDGRSHLRVKQRLDNAWSNQQKGIVLKYKNLKLKREKRRKEECTRQWYIYRFTDHVWWLTVHKVARFWGGCQLRVTWLVTMMTNRAINVCREYVMLELHCSLLSILQWHNPHIYRLWSSLTDINIPVTAVQQPPSAPSAWRRLLSIFLRVAPKRQGHVLSHVMRTWTVLWSVTLVLIQCSYIQ